MVQKNNNTKRVLKVRKKKLSRSEHLKSIFRAFIPTCQRREDYIVRWIYLLFVYLIVILLGFSLQVQLKSACKSEDIVVLSSFKEFPQGSSIDVMSFFLGMISFVHIFGFVTILKLFKIPNDYGLVGDHLRGQLYIQFFGILCYLSFIGVLEFSTRIDFENVLQKLIKEPYQEYKETPATKSAWSKLVEIKKCCDDCNKNKCYVIIRKILKDVIQQTISFTRKALYILIFAFLFTLFFSYTVRTEEPIRELIRKDAEKDFILMEENIKNKLKNAYMYKDYRSKERKADKWAENAMYKATKHTKDPITRIVAHQGAYVK